MLSLAAKANPRGPGFWRLNSHFLKDLEYINLMKETIKEVPNDYEEDETVDAKKILAKTFFFFFQQNNHCKIRVTTKENFVTVC